MKISLALFLCFSFVFRPFFFSKHSYLVNNKKITLWLEDMNFIFSWKKKLHSFAALSREIIFPLEDKLHIFAPPCNIFYSLLHEVQKPIFVFVDLGTCPKGWVKFDKYCYQFNENSRSTWSIARVQCTQQGGDLLSLTSIQEKDFIVYQFKNKIPSYVWIGE